MNRYLLNIYYNNQSTIIPHKESNMAISIIKFFISLWSVAETLYEMLSTIDILLITLPT